mgnify:CR=1 FL=1
MEITEQFVKCPECGRLVKLSNSVNVYDSRGIFICCVCDDCYDRVAIDLLNSEDSSCE